MKNSTIVMLGIIAAVAMLSAAVVIPIQQANASSDTIFKFEQKAKSSASGFGQAFNFQCIRAFSQGGGPLCQSNGPG
jgi:hypothetical protein